jgi:hypothetical protein
MADSFYVEMRNAMLGAWTHSFVDLNTDNTRCALRDEGALALDLVGDFDLADTVAGHVAESANLGTPTVGVVAAGVFDHDNVTFSSVTGASCESIDYYKETGTDSTSPMICNIDSATGLPVTPNGGDITWTPSASGVFQIT